MLDYAHNLVKRGVEIAQQPNQQIYHIDVPRWGIYMVLVTILFFGLIFFSLQYTYGQVVATLAMVESTTTTAIITTTPAPEDLDAKLPEYSELDDTKAPLLEQELLIIKTKPITSRFCATIRHLRSQAGIFSRFRGFHVLAIYDIAFKCYCGLLYSLLPHNLFIRSIVLIFASVLFCRLKATWTHIVISKPSSKRWYKRYIPRSSFRKLAGPTFVAAALQQLALGVPVYLFRASHFGQYMDGPNKFVELTPETAIRVYMNLFSIVLLFLVAVICVVIPAHAALTRVQASLLPEEDEPIVPFDRTFNGRIEPEMLGTKGYYGLREAWKSFDKEARFRLYGVYAKLTAIEMALGMLYIVVVAVELKVMMGDQLGLFVFGAGNRGW